MAWEVPEITPRKAKMINRQLKGKSGEREVLEQFVVLMQRVEDRLEVSEGNRLSRHAKRASHSAAAKGGCDIVGIPKLAVEVKRCETLAVEAWWKQAVEQAEPGAMPVLFYRKSRMPWTVRSWLYLGIQGAPGRWVVADMKLGDFIEWYEAFYSAYLTTPLTAAAQSA